jgi:hypothetical protein
VLGAEMANETTGCDIIIADEVTPEGLDMEAVTMWPMPEDIESVSIVLN